MSTPALITPQVLIWARNSLGMTQEEASGKIGVKETCLSQWESGEKHPTLNQLDKISQVYKRPTVLFYLPAPPKENFPMVDFRTLPDQNIPMSHRIKYAIRLAHQRREVAIKFSGETRDVWNDKKFSVYDDAEKAAIETREKISIEATSKDEKKAFNTWRSSLEKNGILVFQARDVEIQEMRGFSINKFPFPVIAINSKDSVHAKIFTMLHELGHILLHSGGICGAENDKKEEIFCNKFAGCMLIPSKELNEAIQHIPKDKVEWEESELEKLSKTFCASKEVVLRRLLAIGRTSQFFYEQKRSQYLKGSTSEKKNGKQAPIPIQYKKIAEYGYLFPRIVLNAYYDEKITLVDVSDYLDIKLDHLEKIESSLYR